MSNELEIWKDVPNYEGHYQVSNLGRVKSLKRKKEKILADRKDTNGYFIVLLSKDFKEVNFKIHSLVAHAFMNFKFDKNVDLVIDHINNIRTDNRLENLQIITRRQNNSKHIRKVSSKYTGVCWSNRDKKWCSGIKFKGIKINLGSYYNSEIEAKNAYDKALNELNQGLDLNVLYPIGRSKTSKYKYVCFAKTSNLWNAYYKRLNLGFYNTEEEAYQVVQEHIKNLQTK